MLKDFINSQVQEEKRGKQVRLENLRSIEKLLQPFLDFLGI